MAMLSVMELCLRQLLLVIVAVSRTAHAGLFDFTEFDDPFSTLSNINRNGLWRNTLGTHCTVNDTTTSVMQHGVCKNPVDCKLTGGSAKGHGTCQLHQCCVYSGVCGSSTSKKVSYFTSPDFNNANNFPEDDCTYTVKVFSPNVCQMRIDFDDFKIANPRLDSTTDMKGYDCKDDSFTVIAPNQFKAPVICGYNTGQHMYIPVNASNNEQSIKLVMRLAKLRTGTNPGVSTPVPVPHWKIRITQLECPNNGHKIKPVSHHSLSRDFWELAPPGCLQYYRQRTGTVRNFGYEPGQGKNNHYIRNQNYAICFKRTPSTCGMRFTNTGMDTFQLAAQSGLPTMCTDFLFIPETTLLDATGTPVAPGPANYKYCNTDIMQNFVVQSERTMQTPLYIHFVTDAMNADTMTEVGFNLDFQVPPASCPATTTT